MTEIHNAELTQEIVIGAVAAWLEQTNDTALSVDVTFQRDINQNSNQDLLATTKVDILKADDFHPMKRGRHNWCEDDQKMIDEMPRRGSNDVEDHGVVDLVRESYEKWAKPSSAEPESMKENAVCSMKWSDKVEKKVAAKWELPSAEYYPIRYEEHIRRDLNVRKSCGELLTAQEAPAVREKGDANDRTDQDCLTLPRDLHSSKESIVSSEGLPPPPPKEKSPEKKSDPIENPIIPVEEKIPEKVEEKVEEKISEEPKKVEEVKKIEEVTKKEEAPKKEEELPKVGEKKIEEVKKEEEVKVVEEKKEEPPVVIVTEPKPKKKIQVNIKRHPDCGELTILAEKDGIVSFTCSTKHMVKKAKKSDK